MATDLRPPVPDAIQRIANAPDRRLAWEFFVFFSRFEYALKRYQRYLIPATGDAQPNWDRFASDNAVNSRPETSPALRTAVGFCFAQPPRKQLRDQGEIKWPDPQAWDRREPRLVWLFRVVRTVRNNLFHGAKFPYFPIAHPSRDRDLIANGLAILKGALALNPNVRRQFFEGLE